MRHRAVTSPRKQRGYTIERVRINKKALLGELHEIKRYFDPATARRKLKILKTLRTLPLHPIHFLKEYHEELLFISAYPDSPELLRATHSELRRVAQTVREVYRSGSADQQEELNDTGIANSELFCSFSLDAVRWLSERFPRDMDLYWDEEGSASEQLDDFLKEDVLRIEADVVLHDGVSTNDLFRLIGGGESGRALSWLLGRFSESGNTPAVHDRAFEHIAIDSHWRLRSPVASRTFARFPGSVKYFQQKELTRGIDFRSVVRKPLRAPEHLSKKRAGELIDVSRATLLLRHRETDPVMYSHEGDVELFALEDGIEVALFGACPERRRPIESYVGFVAARNKVPVAYGGAWVLGSAAEIGVNVFESFRGGESALLFASIARVYAQRYNLDNYTVDPYQFGRDNEEGIQSGAFWFYYRLGFRPTEQRLRALADREWERIAQSKNYRTAARVLRRLATGPLGISLVGESVTVAPKVDVSAVALAVCKHLGGRYRGKREVAVAEAEQKVRKLLFIPASRRFSPNVQRALSELSLVVLLLPGIKRWSAPERRALGQAILKKGGVRERSYAIAIRRHPKFLSALSELAREGKKISK